jgi:iron(III) transport system substrate-binding protein
MSAHRILIPAALLAVLAASPPAAAEEPFDLDALVAAARAETPITVYAVTGKIVETAEAFAAKYGVEATGKKVDEATQADLLIRENASGNVVGAVSLAADAGSVIAQLLPTGVVESWTPPDIAADIGAAYRDPLVVVFDPQVFAYNTEKYESCPISNIWQLTEPEWKGRVAMLDLFAKPLYADWFNQIEQHHDAAVAAAYEHLYGKPLDTGGESATAAWVKAYAANAPLLGDSTTVSNAIGVAGQEAPFVGITSTAKFRGNASDGLKLGLCAGVEPFSGFLYPSYGVVAAKTESPNAARLFVHYLLTEEGIANQLVDGKVSTNATLALPADEASGLAAHLDEMMTFDSATIADDFDRRQDWQDFWRVNYAK